MRCPKCGYISFDHLEQCLKCKKNIKAVSETLHGTVFHVAAPTFLQLRSQGEEKSKDEEMFTGDLEGDDEFVDEDLDVLVDDDSLLKMEEPSDDAGEEFEKSATPPVEPDGSEDREIAIDLSQFEDTEEKEVALQGSKKVPHEGGEPSLALDFPADLADLSDLAPPARNTQNEKPAGRNSAKAGGADATIDDLNFDLGLGDLEADLASDGDSGKEMILALDDIDFSETLTQDPKKPADKPRGADMNEDLNFDLDLGGLSIHKD
jgi:hypothetical protein